MPIKLIPDALRRAQPSDVETLLVSGTVDFSTPAKFATTELLPHLTKGKQVVVKEAGHVDDLWRGQPGATQRLLTSFHDTGVAADSQYSYASMCFRVRLGFPALFKIMLGVGFALLTAAAAVIRLLVRRL